VKDNIEPVRKKRDRFPWTNNPTKNRRGPREKGEVYIHNRLFRRN